MIESGIQRVVRLMGMLLLSVSLTFGQSGARLAPRVELPEIVGVSASNLRLLSLNEALELALERNPDLAIAKASVKSTGHEVTMAGAAYTPRIAMSSFIARTRTPITDLFSASASGGPAITQNGFTNAFKFEGLSRWGGGRYGVEFSTGRETTNNLYASLLRSNSASLQFTYLQPLARDRAYDLTRQQIEVSRRMADLSDAQFRQRVIEIVSAVQSAYWNLAFARRHTETQQSILTDARSQFESTRRQVGQGLLARSDLAAVEAQIARFESELHSAVESVAKSQNTLKSLLAGDERDELWQAALVPADRPEIAAEPIALDAALQSALTNRLEFVQIDASGAINAANRRFLREQLKPQIDLTVDARFNGLAGRLNANAGAGFGNPVGGALQARVEELSRLAELPPLPAPEFRNPLASLRGGWDDALRGVFQNRFGEVRLGLTIHFPLQNRGARAELGKALAEEERLAAERRKLRLTIQSEIRDALQTLQAAQARAGALIRARLAAEREYLSERRRFAGGVEESSLFLLLEKQKQAATAANEALRAQIEVHQARIELQKSMGTTLQSRNIVLVKNPGSP